MPEKKDCFIIMPITVPEPWLDKYRDGKDHFKHVLECLFMPALEKAGYKPIPPIAKGSDLIHAEIIHNIETAEIVLFDMSCLNPNVFFEFGIRTSLNKPVCVVKDELTPKVPFDTAILNYQEYNSSLDSWFIQAETDKLSKHLTASVERSKGQNTLWKYFAFKTEATAFEPEKGAESKLDYLALQIESMQEKVEMLATRRTPETASASQRAVDRAIHYVGSVLGGEAGPLAFRPVRGERALEVLLEEFISPIKLEEVARVVEQRYGVRVGFVSRLRPGPPEES